MAMPCRHGASWCGGCFRPRALYVTKDGPVLLGLPCTDKPWRGERGGLSGLARSGKLTRQPKQRPDRGAAAAAASLSTQYSY